VQLLTDRTSFAEQAIALPSPAWSRGPGGHAAGVRALVDRLLPGLPVYETHVPTSQAWPHLVAVETADRSQFDVLVQLARDGVDLPDGTLCFAGAGRGLHGQRGRHWAALPGNIHLSLWLAPPGQVTTPIEFLAMTVVSVVEAIDELPGLADRVGIKWVNDVLIDGAKVCGILTHVERRPGGSLGIVGIGLNVEAVPDVPTSPFVPAVTALGAVSSEPDACRLEPVLRGLLAALDRNYRALCREGAADLFARYRRRSVVIGRHAAVCADSADPEPRVVAEGRVRELGPQLELMLEGHPRPFTTGRLVLRP
jgi:BirA family biotin operon repressor/biotin-[acetyl-CoA-carboxylase] ligase